MSLILNMNEGDFMQEIDKNILNLHRLMDKKIELFGNIKEVTLLQEEDIEKNEAKNIEALVQKKQAVINRIDEIDAAFSQQFEGLKKYLKVERLEEIDVKKFPELGELKAKVQKVLSLAQEIMAVEQENKEKINNVFGNLKNQLKSINVGKKSIKAYGPQVLNNDGIYFDRKK